jgi:hypothetical protein
MSGPDHSEIYTIEKRMKTACKRLHDMASEVGMAITIRDYDKDRRRNLLASYALSYIKDGESVSASQLKARANEAYQQAFNGYYETYQQALTTIKIWEAEFAAYDAARSLLARQRETLRTLPETEA